MHELSIATSMVDMASEAATQMGDVRVLAVHLKLGRLSGVVREALLFSWDIACEDTPLAGAQLVIEEAPVVIHCDTCGVGRTLGPEDWLCCPVCETPAPVVLQGRDLEVTALEVQ